MTDVAGSSRPLHRDLWSGLISDDPGAEVGVLGVPFDGAVSFRRGTAAAPDKLRALSTHLAPCAEEGQPLKLRVRDYGDVALDLEWARYFGAVEDRAIEVLQHPLALFLGGDHSVSIPLMRAFNQMVDGPFAVVHFDAHPDLCDVYEGHCWSHACTERRALELPGLAPECLVFVGLRSLIREEWDLLQAHPEIAYYTARQCYRQGIEVVAREVVGRLAGVEAVYFTLDIDGLDPAYAPGTGTPEAGGLSTRDLLEFVRAIFEGLPVRAMDLVEVAPPLDSADITSFAALKVIYEVWGVVQGKQTA
jgi:agmatinase